MNNWNRVDVFDDSNDLAKELRRIAKQAPGEHAYIFREAAENLDGMWQLLKDLELEHKPLALKKVKAV